MRRERGQVSLWRVEPDGTTRVFYVFAPTRGHAAEQFCAAMHAWVPHHVRVFAAGHWDATTGRLHLNEPTTLVENWSGARP